MKLVQHLKQVAIATDQLANTLAGGFADETLSARAWRWELDGVRAWPRRVLDVLFFFDPEHCRASYESERQRRQLPPHYRATQP